MQLSYFNSVRIIKTIQAIYMKLLKYRINYNAIIYFSSPHVICSYNREIHMGTRVIIIL